MTGSGAEQIHRDLAREQLLSGRAVRLRVSGGSMRPVIPMGSTIVTKPLDTPPDVGDVVLLAAPSFLVAHRVVATNPEGRLLTRGDRSRGYDPIGTWEVIGRVSRVELNGIGWHPDRKVARLLARAFSKWDRLKSTLNGNQPDTFTHSCPQTGPETQDGGTPHT